MPILATPPRRIGSLGIGSVRDFQGCLLIEAEDTGFLSRNGYANCPGEPPRGDGTYQFKRIDGNWFTWAYSEPT